MPKAESLLYVSLGSSPEGAPSLGTTQNGIARCKRAVSQCSQNKFKIPQSPRYSVSDLIEKVKQRGNENNESEF